MRVVIAGGHGQVALHLERLIAAAGHQPVGIVRRTEQVADLEAVGAEGVVLDLEQVGVPDLAAVLDGADAVVFAAGGGGDGDAARKETVDKGAAIKLADAAEQAGVRRYVMLSAMGTETADPDSDEVFAIYLRAKQAADEDLRARDLDWTVVKPGHLTDDAATGRVTADSPEAVGEGSVPRADVAAVLLGVLTTTSTIGRTFALVGGETPVDEALARL